MNNTANNSKLPKSFMVFGGIKLFFGVIFGILHLGVGIFIIIKYWPQIIDALF
jgi:hypothetical protein